MSFDEEHLDEHYECRGAYEMEKRIKESYCAKISKVWEVINQLESEDDVVPIRSIASVLREALQDD